MAVDSVIDASDNKTKA